MDRVTRSNDYQELLRACHLPFKYWQHEFLQGKFIYVRVQDTVLRLNSLGVPWSFDQGPVTMTESETKTSSGKTQYDAVTYGQLSIEGMGSRGAPGASTNTDKDNASKAAHSFALRKAASLFGVSHYLMQNPKEETELVNFMHGADLTNVTDLKRAIKIISSIEGVLPIDWLASHGVVDSNNVGQLKTALERAGRI